MYQRIAVAVDGSPTSDRALDEALKLARESKASLLLLHVSETPLPTWESADMIASMPPAVSYELVEKIGQEILERAAAKAHAAGVNAETRLVEEGGERIGTVIANAARDWQADLLVIGSHGRKGLERFLLGSVAEGVMRAASMPVLLVRGH